METTLDYSFLELAQFKEVAKEQPRSGKKKSAVHGLRLSSNEFAKWDGFSSAVKEVVQDPQERRCRWRVSSMFMYLFIY